MNNNINIDYVISKLNNITLSLRQKNSDLYPGYITLSNEINSLDDLESYLLKNKN